MLIRRAKQGYSISIAGSGRWRGNRIWRARCSGIGAWLPRPLAGEGWGEGVSTTGQSPRGKNPHPPRCRLDPHQHASGPRS
ncbi:hypothetical protein EAS54_38660 [Bradyrhizobium guangzhouense]|nr:hypothetical protein EAS54_38660 [Bradyrhizobium guangzhouense]